MPSARQDVRQAIFLSFIMVVLASTAVAATKYASGHASTVTIVTVQYLVCTLFCLPRILRRGLSSLHTDRTGLHFWRGLAGVLGFYLFYASLNHIPMVDAMMLRQAAPLVVPLVLWVWSREMVATSAWLPLLIGFVGIGVILRPSSDGLSWWHGAGFLSAVMLAISMVATNRLGKTEPASRILFYYCVLSLICVAPFSLSDVDQLHLLDWVDWLAMLYVGISIYGTLELYTRAYGMAPTATIAPINYFAVILSGVWGWLFWDQIPDRWSLVGSALVIAGGLLTIYLAKNKPRD